MLDLNKAAGHMRQVTLKERGKQLRKFRKEIGMDMVSLALLVGLNQSTISKFERGLNEMRVETYARLLQAMDYVEGYRKTLIGYIEQDIANHPPAKGVPLSKLATFTSTEDYLNYMGSPFGQMSEKERNKWITERTRDRFAQKIQPSEYEAQLTAQIAEHQKEIANLLRQIAQLRDLLNLETEIALKTSEAESLREKIKA